jgi:hypothetical protein
MIDSVIESQRDAGTRCAKRYQTLCKSERVVENGADIAKLSGKLQKQRAKTRRYQMRMLRAKHALRVEDEDVPAVVFLKEALGSLLKLGPGQGPITKSGEKRGRQEVGSESETEEDENCAKNSLSHQTCPVCKGRTESEICRDYLVQFMTKGAKGRWENDYRFMWMQMEVHISRETVPSIIQIILQTFGVSDRLDQLVPSKATLSNCMVDMEAIARVHLGEVAATSENCCLVTDASKKNDTSYRSNVWATDPVEGSDKPRECFAGFVEQSSGRAADECAAIVDQLEQTRLVAMELNPERYPPSPPSLSFFFSQVHACVPLLPSAPFADKIPTTNKHDTSQAAGCSKAQRHHLE